jgi:hypothetical protein
VANTQPQNASQPSLPAGKRRRLLKFGVTELSLVDKGAVGQSRYVIAKRDPNAASGGDVDAIVAAVGSGGAGSAESISKAKPSESSGSGPAEVSASGVSVGESAMSFPWESDSELMAIISTMARDRVRAALADMPKESQDEVGEHVESKQMHPALSPVVSDICGEQNNGVWALRNVDVADPRQKDALCGKVELSVVMVADDLLNWWRVKPNFVVDMANDGYASMIADIGRKVLGAAGRLDIEQWKSSGIAPQWLNEKALDAAKFGDYSPRDFGGSNVMAQHAQAVADAVVAWASGVVMAGGLPVEKAYASGGKSCSSKVEKGGDKKPSSPAGKKAPPFGKKPGDAKSSSKKPNPFAKKPADDKASGRDGEGDDANAKPDGKKKFPFAKAATPAPKSAEKGPDGKFAWENDENLKALLEREGARGVNEAMPDVDESDAGSVAEMAAAGSLHPKLGEMRDKIRSFQPELWSTHGIDMNDPRQVEALDRHLHAAMVAAAAGGGEGGGIGGEGGADGSAVDPVIDPAAANVNTIGMTGDESAEGGDADGSEDAMAIVEGGGEPISDDIEDGMEAEATEGESVDGATDDGMDASMDGADGMESGTGEGMDADAGESADDGEGEVEPFLPAEGEDGGEVAGDMEDGESADEAEGDEPSEDVVNAIGAIANELMEDVAEQVGEERLPELANAINEAEGEIPEELSQLIDDAIVAASDDLMEVGMDVNDADQSASVKEMIIAALVAMMGDDGQDVVEDAVEGEDEGEMEDGEEELDEEEGDEDEEEEEGDDSSIPAGLGKSYCSPGQSPCTDSIAPPPSPAGLCSADQDSISRAVADAITCLRSVAHLLDPAGLNMLASIMSWADACCRPCDELLKALNTKVPAKRLHGETRQATEKQSGESQHSANEQDELAALDREIERRELEKRQREEEAEASLLLQRLNEFATRLETHTAQMEQLETRIGRVSGGK